jgi:hypothetical protein
MLLTLRYTPLLFILPPGEIPRVCSVRVEEGEAGARTKTSDVLEVSEKVVDLGKKQRIIKFGSVGRGFNAFGDLWNQHQQVFSAQNTAVEHTREYGGAELGAPGRVRKEVLNTHPVEVLGIDCCSSNVWRRWLDHCRVENLPRGIFCLNPSSILLEEGDVLGKSFRTDMKRRGYHSRHWHLRAWEHGSALNQTRVLTVFWQGNVGIVEPRRIDLPLRSMANLLMPVGVPHNAWSRIEKTPAVSTEWRGACQITGRIRSQDVHGIAGGMPDRIGSWIEVDRGVRLLQGSELGKGKGFTEFATLPTGSGGVRAIGESTCLHLMAASCDAISAWFLSGSGSTQFAAVEPPVTKREESEADEAYTWNWDVPDLSEGSAFYIARTTSLREAVKDLEDSEYWYQEGLECLARHRTNYTTEGPQQLQLLWWEFPVQHHEALREGCRLGFLLHPSGQVVENGPMTDEDRKVAGRFVDELTSLGVLQPATVPLEGNCPLFCVDKAYDSTQKRCIANCKEGGQNACMGKDPVYLVGKEVMLGQLYTGGYTAIADASKQFHNFPVHPEERHLLGCIHPVTAAELVYAGLPMGTTNSPPIACRINNGAMRQLRDQDELFQGSIRVNTWANCMGGVPYVPEYGHGRVLLDRDGLPSVKIFTIVDDYFVHGPTKAKTGAAFSRFMDHMLRLGFICQKVKTSAPGQCPKFCGVLWDTEGTPTIRLPDDKVSRGLATIDYGLLLDEERKLSRLSASVMGGLLQSMVDATPSRQGQVYLRQLYDDVHHTSEAYGKELYYTIMTLSDTCKGDLLWWKELLQRNPGNKSASGSMASMEITWGDGSGTGTGGTSETMVNGAHGSTTMISWMGGWGPHVHHYDSNWRELRTLLWTLQRKLRDKGSAGATLFYFTDNLVTYFIVMNGSSRNPDLHALIREIKLLEALLGCRIEVVHVPGLVMILQSSDGLSRGVWTSADRLLRSSIEESRLALGGVPYTVLLGEWARQVLGLAPGTPLEHQDDYSDWSSCRILRQWSVWTPSPEVARQSIAHFLDIWVEEPWWTGGIFLIPRVLQKQWGFMSKSMVEWGVYDPSSLPWGARYASLIPLVVVVCFPHLRRLPENKDGVERSTIARPLERWHAAQADDMRRLQRGV